TALRSADVSCARPRARCGWPGAVFCGREDTEAGRGPRGVRRAWLEGGAQTGEGRAMEATRLGEAAPAGAEEGTVERGRVVAHTCDPPAARPSAEGGARPAVRARVTEKPRSGCAARLQ